MEKRVIVYVDGFNLYYGKKENNWKRYYWLDFVTFFEKFMGENQTLVKVKYFTAVPDNLSKAGRQDKLFQVNKENAKFQLIFGSYLKKIIECPACYEKFEVPEEKKTDVNIATQLMLDVIENNCDISIIVSGDSDLTPPIDFIKSKHPAHIITVFFPPKRQSLHLKRLAHNVLYLQNYQNHFKNSLFADEVELSDGYKIKRPDSWR